MDKILANFGGVNSPVRISLSVYENVHMIDIRKFYKDRKTLELKPTSKGISLTQGTFNEMLECLNKDAAVIGKWLNQAEDNDGENQLLHQKSKKDNIKIPNEVQIVFSESRSSLAYDVVSEGGSAMLIFNSKHPFVKEITKKENYSRAEVENIIAKMIVGIHVARFQSEVDGSHDGNIVDFLSMQNLCSRLLEKSFKD